MNATATKMVDEAGNEHKADHTFEANGKTWEVCTCGLHTERKAS